MGLKTNLKLMYLKTRYFLKKGNPFFEEGNFFKDKRIIIVGPADSSLTYLSGEEIDKFDYVVRVNNSTMTVPKLKDRIGFRTDILFHCLGVTNHHGVVAFSPETLIKQRTKLILYVCSEKKTTRKFYKYGLKFPSLPLKRLNSYWWNSIKNGYKVKFPTTGLVALVYLMKQDFRELHITGFTFYRTNYVTGYDIDASKETALERIKDYVQHDPNEDFAKFISEYELELSRGKQILLDPVLLNLVSEYQLERNENVK